MKASQVGKVGMPPLFFGLHSHPGARGLLC